MWMHFCVSLYNCQKLAIFDTILPFYKNSLMHVSYEKISAHDLWAYFLS